MLLSILPEIERNMNFGAVDFSDGSVRSICEIVEKIRREKEADLGKFVEGKEGISKRAEAIFDRNVIDRKMEMMFKAVFGPARNDED